ncbi:hypothetical protein [Burkholderia sp. Ac-20344]|uniref:hypothetical protein n=1 Tax=Burkholderia sp. Ac-20344 TaxID=2703890 RepID=UPI00197B4FDA|nr:hypothetical protein [Burkholderia sp. Ac-20344]MBN3833161.1 hypothetical protein [Burkholderia sp. Ac-20344]
MQTITTQLLAGQRMAMPIAGTVFLIQAADQGNNLNVRFFSNNAVVGEVDNVGTAFKTAPAGGFSGIDLLAAVNTNVTFIIATGDVDLQLSNLGVQITNTPGNPVPVSIIGEPGAPFPVQPVPAGTVATDLASVAVANAGGVLVAAAAGRKSLRVRNVGPGQLAITAAAGTAFANAAIVLQVGDTFIETDAPQAAWYAVSDTNTTAAMQVVA